MRVNGKCHCGAISYEATVDQCPVRRQPRLGVTPRRWRFLQGENGGDDGLREHGASRTRKQHQRGPRQVSVPVSSRRWSAAREFASIATGSILEACKPLHPFFGMNGHRWFRSFDPSKHGVPAGTSLRAPWVR